MSPKKGLHSTLPTTKTPPHHHRYCTLTTIVKSISTLHTSFYTPHHFPKFLFGFMSISGVAGYYCMDWWYERSLAERQNIYNAAYHTNHQNQSREDQVKRQVTARDGHYKRRKALFVERLSPYQQTVLQQQQQQQQQQCDDGSTSLETEKQQKRLVTLNVVAPVTTTNQSISLQRQVTKFW